MSKEKKLTIAVPQHLYDKAKLLLPHGFLNEALKQVLISMLEYLESGNSMSRLAVLLEGRLHLEERKTQHDTTTATKVVPKYERYRETGSSPRSALEEAVMGQKVGGILADAGDLRRTVLLSPQDLTEEEEAED